MAIFTTLFSFLARKAGDIVQAIFGWSITALFGRLPKKSRVLVIVSLVFSLAWPFFVLGVVWPDAAAWAIALVPLHDLVGDETLRAIWIALAIISPVIVGILVWRAAPARRGTILRAIINGFPTALGFFVAFIVVAVTVPIIKVASIIRRWSDHHVYVQPHEGQYKAVVQALAEACARAGYAPKISDAPRYMVFATSVIRTLASGAVKPFVTEKLQRIAADGIEMYVYPADLLMRGKAAKIAHVRAMFERTKLDAHAYLVGSADAQTIEREISRLEETLDGADNELYDVRSLLATQLRQAYAQLMRIDIPYEEFVILRAKARRFERRLLAEGLVSPDNLPIDAVTDQLDEVRDEFDAVHESPSWLPPQAAPIH